jgi:iron(III) transport system substrate-binding protein
VKIANFIIAALLLLPSRAWTQEQKPASIAELASYRGKDREALLYAGAKSEGKITWYTSLAGDSYKEMAKAFEAKYPGVKVESFRAAGADLVIRMEEEAKARRSIADSIETTEGSLIFLRDDKLLRPYDSPYLDKYPEEGKERANKSLVYWALARESYIGFAYNTKLVPKEAVPKNFDGLFHPQLKGRMGISIGQTSDKIIGAMIRTRGEEMVKKLKGQEIKLYSIGCRQ